MQSWTAKVYKKLEINNCAIYKGTLKGHTHTPALDNSVDQSLTVHIYFANGKSFELSFRESGNAPGKVIAYHYYR